MFYCKKCKNFHDEPGEYDGFSILPSCPECGEKMSPTPAIGYGTKINGFIIQHELGRGAVGAVYLAKQCNADVFVAVKVLLPSSMKEAKFAENFFREARAAAALNHPNIVHAQDAGITDEGICYFIMELIEGENLEQKVERTGPLSMLDAFDAACCISDALAYAWRSQKLCHGDIKPENIIVRPDGVVKLADLGLAKDYKNGSSSSSEGEIMATPAYAPPEVIRGEFDKISFKSDMYSFGETLYHVLTGAPPFPGSDAAAVCDMQLNNQPPPVIAVNDAVPGALSMLIDDLMEKSPDKRPASWDEVNRRLEEIRNEWIGKNVKKAKPVDTGVRLLPEDDDDEPQADKDANVTAEEEKTARETQKPKKKIIVVQHGNSAFNVVAMIVIIHLVIIAIFYALYCELTEPGYLGKTYNDAKAMTRNALNSLGIEADFITVEEPSDEPDVKSEEADETTPKEEPVTAEEIITVAKDASEKENAAEKKISENVRKDVETTSAVQGKEEDFAVQKERKKRSAENAKVQKLGVARDNLFREIEENNPIRYRSDVLERQNRAKSFLADVDKSGVAEQVLSNKERALIEGYVAALEKLFVSHPAPPEAEQVLSYVRNRKYEKEKSSAELEVQKDRIGRILMKDNEVTTGGFLSEKDVTMLKKAIEKIDLKKAEIRNRSSKKSRGNSSSKLTKEDAHMAINYAMLSCSATNEAGTKKLLKELDDCEEKYKGLISESDAKVIADVRNLCKDAWTKSIPSIIKEEGDNLKGIEILPRELPGYKIESVDSSKIKVMMSSGGAKVYSYIRFSELDGKDQYALVSKLVYSNNLKNFSEKNQRILLKRILISGRSIDNAAAKFRRSSKLTIEEIDSLVRTAKFLNEK